MWPRLQQQLQHAREWTRPISNQEARGLKEHLRQGVTGVTLLAMVVSLVALFSFWRHGGQSSPLLYFILTLIAVQVFLLWRVRRPPEQYHGALGLAPPSIMVVVHLMLNLNLSMTRSNAILLYLGMPVLLSAFFPMAPVRLGLVGLGSTALAITILHHALAMPAHLLALVGVVGALYTYLGASASQLQRRVWLQLEQKRGQVSAMERLTELGQRTASLVHALKTPVASGLNSLHSAADLQRELARSIGHPQVQRQDLHEISQELEEALRLAERRALDLGQTLQTIRARTTSHTHQRQRVDLGACLQHLAQTARYQDLALQVELHLPSEPVYIELDSGHLEQVLEQLLQNATEAMERSGVGDTLWLELVPERDHVTVVVRDNGPGVPAQLQPSLFKTRSSLQRMARQEALKRAGLGLPICRDIARGPLGGELALVPSTQGARFELRLPLRGEGQAQRAPRSTWRPTFSGRPP